MAVRTTYNAAVSFESDREAVRAYRAEIICGSPQKAASRALQGARKAYPGARPRSIVVVLEIGARVELPKKAKAA